MFIIFRRNWKETFVFFLGFVLSVVVWKHILLSFLSNNEISSENSLEVIPDDNSVLDTITKKVKILCWIMGNPARQYKWLHLRELWGKNCDKFIITTSKSKFVQVEDLEILGLDFPEGRDQLWNRERAAFIHVYTKYINDYDYIMKADDDSYVVMENLKYLLYQHNASLRLLFGERFQVAFAKKGYMSGMMVVLSRAALKRLVYKIINKQCLQNHPVNEDVNVGECLRDEVLQVDTRDDFKRHTIFPVGVDSYISLENQDVSYWIWVYLFNKVYRKYECCSENFIAIHYTPIELQYLYRYFFFDVSIFGRNKHRPVPLPKKRTLLQAAMASLDIEIENR